MSLFSSPSFEVGRVFGVPVKLDISLALLAGYYVLRTRSLVYGLVCACALAAAVLLHELGHVAVAQAFGSRVRDVTLMFFGGYASLYNMPRTPWKEAAIAFAGPAAGILLWLACPFLAALMPVRILAALVAEVGAISLWLALFNLIPAFPMDGGRIFRALLAHFKGRIWATRVSCKIAYGLAVAMGILGLLGRDAFLLLIAFFVWSTARSELDALRFCDTDDDDDTIVISPPPYGRGNDYTKIHRER